MDETCIGICATICLEGHYSGYIVGKKGWVCRFQFKAILGQRPSAFRVCKVAGQESRE